MWYGIDREYSPVHGLMTLFVESNNPDIDTVIQVLSELNVDIECIYFGAGEVDITNWEFIDSLYKLSDTFKVVVESFKLVPQYATQYFDAVILRLPVSCASKNTYIKYRSNMTVGIMKASEFKCNSLFDLQDGQYSCDIEVYNEGEK